MPYLLSINQSQYILMFQELEHACLREDFEEVWQSKWLRQSIEPLSNHFPHAFE